MNTKTVEKEIEDVGVKTKGFKLNFDDINAQNEVVAVEEKKQDSKLFGGLTQEEVYAATQKYGKEINISKNDNSELFELDLSKLSEEELKNLDKEIENLKSSLFNDKDLMRTSNNLMKLSMNLTSQVSDSYNALSKDRAKNTKLDKFSEISKPLNEMNDLIKGLPDLHKANSNNIVNRVINVFKRTKREIEKNSEKTVEDKVSIIEKALKQSRNEQMELILDHNKRDDEVLEFIKEIDKTLYVTRELLNEVENKRILLGERAIKDKDPLPISLTHYSDFEDQEKDLMNLMRNLRVIKFDINTSIMKNSEMRSTHKTVLGVLNNFIAFAVPKYREQLLEYAREDKLKQAIEIVDIFKKQIDMLDKVSMKNYQEIRLKAGRLSNETFYNLNTISDTIDVILETRELLNAQEELRVLQDKENDMFMNEYDKKMKEFAVGKLGIKGVKK